MPLRLAGPALALPLCCSSRFFSYFNGSMLCSRVQHMVTNRVHSRSFFQHVHGKFHRLLPAFKNVNSLGHFYGKKRFRSMA